MKANGRTGYIAVTYEIIWQTMTFRMELQVEHMVYLVGNYVFLCSIAYQKLALEITLH